MISRTSFYFIVVLLIAIGSGIAWLRHVQTDEPFLPGAQQQVWQVEARIDFDADGGPVTVRLALPEASGRYVLFNEQAASPGYGFSIVRKDGLRRGEWSKREASGAQRLYYKAEFLARQASDEHALAIAAPRQARAVFWPEEAAATAASQLVTAALERSSNAESLARELVKQLNAADRSQNARLLLEQPMDRARLLDTLLNQAGVPARVVMGLYLEDARRQQALTPMVQIATEDGAAIVDPDTGHEGVPENLLLWQHDSDGILTVSGGRDSLLGFSMITRSVPAGQLARNQAESSLFNLVGVHLLPIEAQSMFKLLFLLPIGALVVVFMRLLVGVKTSGTFMPILIAMAFLQTSLIPGLLSFVLIVAFGLVLRNYLSYLNLLMVARISTLIVLVVFIIAFLSLAAYQLGISTGITITFFPMIIIAWTIERMSILWEEEGPREVLVQGSGSLLVALIGFLLMDWPVAQHLSFNFPELNLIVIALILLMGQYTGYRLSELRRFRDVVSHEQ